ncbi:MAG TPA: hypothetical protein DEO82_02770 [Eubacterium sp.]|nr:hypothetical protein [Eubacterium sp.]
MKGLELAREYYHTYGKKLISDYASNPDSVCAGLVGEGSECLGFDDETSKDHDFGGICIFVPDETTDEELKRLSDAYEELVKKTVEKTGKSIYGDGRRGVFRVSQFYENLLGTDPFAITDVDLIFIPDYCIANATSGEIFCEGDGTFVRIRDKLKVMPRDVKLKKLAARMGYMAQYGQYNYMRMYNRGEFCACLVAKAEFMKQAAWACYLLEGKYSPYYKWMFRGLDGLGDFAKGIKERLNRLNTLEGYECFCEIEEIASCFTEELISQGISDEKDTYLERQGLSLMRHIEDNTMKGMHLLM